MLRTIHLHGRLGKRFGRRFDLDASSVADAVRALTVQLPGFGDYIRHRGYAVTVGRGTSLGQEQVALRLGSIRDIHVTPAGAVSGIETILLGATLLFAAIASVGVLTMPKAPTAASREQATKTASFIFDGPENNTEQGHPVALIYGRFRVGSTVVSAGISTTDANAASVSTNPTAPYYGGSGDAGATYGGYVGSTPGFKDSKFGDEWNVVALDKGGKSGSSAARSAQEDPNTLQSQATAKIVDLLGEGEIGGLVNGLQSVFFDGTPLQNPDGTFNFAGVAVEQRFGLPDQDFVPGFSDTENTRSIDTKVSVAIGPVTRSVTDSDVSVARVTIRLPQLYRQDTTNGDLKTSDVAVKVSVQADGGGFTDVSTMSFVGKTDSGYQRSLDVRLPNGNLRDIRVTRLTPDSTVASLVNETRFDLLTDVVEAKLSYPDSALVALTVDARQFGSNIPTRSYEVYGLIIDVPSNYDPITRAYTGVWDGTFKRAWTDNPAWVFRDLLVNRRYGLGARVPQGAIDKWGLYAIAQYCDQLVPDMLGGQEPRYTINCVITNPASAYDLLASIASNFRATSYWGSGAVMLVQDRPEDPSILVTPSNVADGVISYGRITPMEKRRSAAIVYWNDPEDGYRLTPEIHEDPALIRRFGRRVGQEVTAFGVVRRGHAHRLCRWLLEDESQGSNSTAAYGVGDDHAFAEPGRVAVVADPMFTASRRGGRVVGAGTNAVSLDAPVTLAAGTAYTLRVVLPDGTVRVRSVTTPAGSATTLQLGGAGYATLPIPGAVWTLESAAVANRQFRLRGISTDEPPYQVQAVLHDPTKFDRVEQDRDIATPPFISLPDGPLSQPGGVGAREFLLQDGTASIPSVQVSWGGAGDPRVTFYQAQFQRPGGAWEPLADGLDLTRVVRGTQAGTWGFRVRSLDSLGNKTGWVEAAVVLTGQVQSLPNVSGLTLTSDANAATATLAWVRPTDFRPLRYEVLYSATSSFGTATSLGLTDARSYTVAFPGYYWVRTAFIDARSGSPPGIYVAASALPGFSIAAAITAAQAAADNAASAAAALADDGILSGAEKAEVLAPRNTELEAQWALLDAQAAAIGSPVSTARTSASTKRSAWLTYRNGLNPAWNDYDQDTTVDRPTFNAKITDYRYGIDALAEALRQYAATTAAWPSVSDPLGTRPTNNADVTAANVAAGFAGQGIGATANSLYDLDPAAKAQLDAASATSAPSAVKKYGTGSTGIANSGWQIALAITVNNVPTTPFLDFELTFGTASISGSGGNWNGQFRISEAGGSVLYGPSGLSVDGSVGGDVSPFSTTTSATGTLSGTVTYYVEAQKSNGGTMTNISSELTISATLQG